MQADDTAEELAQKKQGLHAWISEHSSELIAAFRPFARQLYEEKGRVPEETVTELLNEVTRRALEDPARYDPSRPPLAWLLGIARNVTLEWRDREIKWRQRYKNAIPDEDGAEGQGSAVYAQMLLGSSPDIAGPVIETVWAQQTLAAAPLAHREIIAAFIANDYDTASTARQLQTTSVNVRQRLVRARRWFQERMPQNDLSLSSGGTR